MLKFGKNEAQRLILGAAYSYKDYVQNPNVYVPLIAFADAHGAPMQRFYNLLCIGYGADPQLFGGLVAKGYLPKNRADSCRSEFDELSYAFQHVIEFPSRSATGQGSIEQELAPPYDVSPAAAWPDASGAIVATLG